MIDGKWHAHHRLGWNNWTFGVWWNTKSDHYPAFGIDIGPLELCWKKSIKRRPTAKAMLNELRAKEAQWRTES